VAASEFYDEEKGVYDPQEKQGRHQTTDEMIALVDRLAASSNRLDRRRN
jgi:enolase